MLMGADLGPEQVGAPGSIGLGENWAGVTGYPSLPLTASADMSFLHQSRSICFLDAENRSNDRALRH